MFLVHIGKHFQEIVKGATKLYFMYCFHAVIILFSPGLYKSAYPYILIELRYFYCVFTTHMTSICGEKELTNIFVEFDYFTEAATGWVLHKRCSKDGSLAQ